MATVLVSSQPGQFLLDGSQDRFESGRNPQLHQGDQPPVGANPLLIGMNTKPAIG
jgi:hypothetical protein